MRRSLACVFALLLIALLGTVRSLAEVKAIVIASREPWLQGKTMGAAGAYEKVQGRITFSVDPKAKANQRIADIDLAPLDKGGMVEFSSDFVILRPVDPAKARPSVFLEVLNRGRTQASYSFFQSAPKSPFNIENLDAAKLSDAFVFEQGFTVAWIGWQFDLPEGKVRVHVPTASTGSLVREAFLPDQKESASGLHSLAESYCAADSIQTSATLTSKEHFDGPLHLLPRSEWSFSHAKDGKPVADPCFISLRGGFKSGHMYEAVYQGVPAPLAGLGLAAIRDFTSYLKYGGIDSALREHPETEQRVIGYGYSQSARLLRQYLYQGFTADEHGRQTFDGLFIASGGAGRGSFNHRYADPSDAGNSVLSDLRPVDLFPFTDGKQRDLGGEKSNGLLYEANQSRTLPKIFYVYSSSEYWARVGSLAYTTVDGKKELPIDPSARLYFFTGVPHAHVPFSPSKESPRTGDLYTNFLNFASSETSFRALLLDLDSWAAKGEMPPASVYPHLGQDLVARENVQFPKIPGLDFPAYIPQNWKMDFGSAFAATGVITNEPPKLGPEYTALVPQVDADGNDLGGIALPFLAVPLGTYTGWNRQLPQLPSFHYLGGLIGSFQPFARTKAEREKSGDPRLSTGERYKNREEYLSKIHSVAMKLVDGRLLRAEDVSKVEEESGLYWNFASNPDKTFDNPKR